MPQFTLKTSDGQQKRVPLVKRLTSVGSSPDNDEVLPDGSVAPSAFSVLFDGTGYTAAATGGALSINGKKRDEHRLQPGDVIAVGTCELRFELEDSKPTPAPE